jgi:hypothetical protein
MAKALYVHVGAPKSGSTYLQGRMHASTSALAGGGVLVPGTHADHFRLMMHATGRDDALRRPEAGRTSWDRIFDEVNAWPERAVVSHEMLCIASADQARAVLDAAASAETHVVYTVRDLARILPSEWQQSVRGGLTLGFDAYVRAIRDLTPDADSFSAMHDVAQVLDRWGSGLDPAHVHVVTVPRHGSDPDLLWQRFAQVVGIDPGTPYADGGRANESLGAVEAELLRRVNVAVRQVVDDDPGLVRWVRRNIALDLLARRPGQQRFALRPGDFAWVAERARETVGEMDARGYDVVGDRTELVPDRPAADTAQPDDVGADDIAAAAVETIAGLVASLRDGGSRPREPAEAAGSDS